MTYILFVSLNGHHARDNFDIVVFQKMHKVLVVCVFFRNFGNVAVRHGFVCIFFKKVLAFNYTGCIQNFRPFDARGVERDHHVIV